MQAPGPVDLPLAPLLPLLVPGELLPAQWLGIAVLQRPCGLHFRMDNWIITVWGLHAKQAKHLSVLKAFEGMDYLLPTISKDFAGLIPRPSGADSALRWLKDALRRRGVAQEHVTPLTWHSFRVFIPDCAFQLGVPRSERLLAH